MSPWVAYLLGVFSPVILCGFLLGLIWIIAYNTKREEDKYWHRETEPLRDLLRQEILTTSCSGRRIKLCDFPPEDRKVLQEVSEW